MPQKLSISIKFLIAALYPVGLILLFRYMSRP